MADKSKKFKTLRLTEINRMDEMLSCATQAQTDTTIHPIFKMRYPFVDVVKEEFSKLHTSIISLIPPDDQNVEFEIEDAIRKQFESNFYIIKAIHFGLFEDKTNSNNSVALSQGKINVSLPKLQLLTFSGDVTTFSSFLDMFDAMIHNNQSLANVEKFNYLVSALKGIPLSLVQKVPMTSMNYPIAYDTLVKRYKNDRLIAAAHWSAIENTAKLTSDNSQDLRNLLDTFEDHLAALKLLKLPVDKWDFILVQMILKRVDISIATKFELNHDSSSMPTYNELTTFLTKRCSALDNITSTRKVKLIKKIEYSKPSTSISRPSFSLVSNSTSLSCILCKNNHYIYKCPEFTQKSATERYRIVKDNGFCLNCLSNSHTIKQCKSSFSCHKCQQKHHTMLHFDQTVVHSQSSMLKLPSDSSATSSGTSQLNSSSNFSMQSLTLTEISSPQFSNVLLSTAIVDILDGRGNYQSIRLLLDSGSQSNFISQKCALRLGITSYNMNFSVQGIGNTSSLTSSRGISCTIRPRGKSTPTFDLDAVVIPRICGKLPSSPLPIESWSHIKHIQLADPNFNTPGAIDLLIGADLFPHILQSGRLVGSHSEPVALNKYCLWVRSNGKKTNSSQQSTHTLSLLSCNDSLENTLQKFWDVEEVPHIHCLSPEDKRCESLFLDTTYRTDSGRFVVSLPFRLGEPEFSDTRTMAMNRFLSLERRLLKDPNLYNNYSAFMKDYIDLGHMELVQDTPNLDKIFYIPHHAVLKPSSSTTKLRVVFNASAHTPGQHSLNDTLLTGPKLQRDLVKEPIQDYRLLTITYGFSCAPYLALKCLLVLAEEGRYTLPAAARVIESDTYVDDIVTGANTLHEAKTLQAQIITLLSKGDFELRKWASNDPRLLAHIPRSHLCDETQSLNFEYDNPLKILGLQWNPSSDCFSFSVQPMDTSCTKRNLLSNLAKIFDPLGILTPITFYVQYIIQRLWTLQLDWDDSPPVDIIHTWEQYTIGTSLLGPIQTFPLFAS